MAKRGSESTFLDDYEEPDELRQLVAEGKLPATAIVSGEQLTMRPGQSLAEKARELGCNIFTSYMVLRMAWSILLTRLRATEGAHEYPTRTLR